MQKSCPVCGDTFEASTPQSHCSDVCRLTPKVVISDTGCWEWTGARVKEGYGRFSFVVGGKRLSVPAHRVAYELLVGPIPDGLHIDHLCRNRACVNPDHLEPVTMLENFRRGMSPSMVTFRTGFCRRGHSMEDAVPKTNGQRTCRTCANQNRREHYAKQREAAR